MLTPATNMNGIPSRAAVRTGIGLQGGTPHEIFSVPRHLVKPHLPAEQAELWEALKERERAVEPRAARREAVVAL